MATKANLKTIPVEHHIVSSSDVVEYLQNQLGIAFDCDFQLLDNRADWEKPMTSSRSCSRRICRRLVSIL